MRQALRFVWTLAFCLLVAAPVLAQGDEKPKATGTTQKPENTVIATLKDLFTDIWFVVGLVALLTLVGVLIYVKKKQSEDD